MASHRPFVPRIGRRRPGILLLGAMVGAITMTVSACADDGAGGSSSATASVVSAEIFAGTAADSSAAPVVIGFHNGEGGAYSFPEVRVGFEEGVKYVNAQLGGINNRPLEAIICKEDVTPEASVGCANQFVSKRVAMAVQGVDVNNDAVLPVLKSAGIADVGFFAFTPLTNKANQGAWTMLFSNEEIFAADLIAAKNLGARKVAFVQADTPVYHAAYDEVVVPTAKKLGLETKSFFVPPTVDWTSLAATVAAYQPDLVEQAVGNDSECLGMIPALRAIGYTNYIHPSSCKSIRDLPASDLEKVVTHANFWGPDNLDPPEKVKNELAIWSAYMQRDHPQFKSAEDTQLGFFVAVQAASVLRQVKGEVTAASVLETIPSATGDRFFTTNRYNCGKPAWPGTSSCGSGIFYSTWTEDKKLKVLFPPIDVSSVRPGS